MPPDDGSPRKTRMSSMRHQRRMLAVLAGAAVIALTIPFVFPREGQPGMLGPLWSGAVANVDGETASSGDMATSSEMAGDTQGPVTTGAAQSASARGSNPSTTAAGSPAPTTAATAPGGGPTAAPTVAPPGSAIAVPASIDSSGATDASAALNAWLATVPNGSTVAFAAGGVYRMDHGLVFSNRHSLTFEGNGATLRANGSGSAPADSPFALWQGNDHIVIKDFKIVGNNPHPGRLTSEGQAAILLHGNSNVEVSHVTISNPWSDCIYSGVTSSHVGVNGLWFHDSTCTGTGRSGISITGGSNVTIERVRFNGIGLHVLNIEPDFARDSVSHVYFRNNTVGSYALTTNWIGFLFASNGAAAKVSDVRVTGNRVTGTAHEGYDGQPRGLNTYVMTAGRSNIVFSNNTSTQKVAGPALSFQYVNGLTVTGNVQPLSSGSLAYINSCTGVTYP